MNSSQRFLALDVLRGMTICFMIIVNTPGNGATSYPPLLHAHWNGFTPTDLVFPTFMFVVGNAMSFAMKKWEGLPNAQVNWKIFKRALIIFLLGYFMYWFPFVHWNEQHQLIGNPISHTRIMGVLQRIALGYLFAALMIRYLKPTTVAQLSWYFIVIYWVILLLFGDYHDPYNMLTNAGTKLDMWLFGPNHLYHGEGVPFDPEGVLSTLPAIANVTFGRGVSSNTGPVLGLVFPCQQEVMDGKFCFADCWDRLSYPGRIDLHNRFFRTSPMDLFFRSVWKKSAVHLFTFRNRSNIALVYPPRAGSSATSFMAI
jgi:predicted acyltransferase